MADKKQTFREKANENRDEVITFWGSAKGLVIAGLILVGAVGIFLWDTVADIVGAFIG